LDIRPHNSATDTDHDIPLAKILVHRGGK
jgi:hypothetical protein